MLYPAQLEKKLGFDAVKELIKQFCYSDLGQQYVERMQFITSQELILKLARQTAEFKDLLNSGIQTPQKHIDTHQAALMKTRTEGLAISGEEFYALKLSIESAMYMLEVFKHQRFKFPYLWLTAERLNLDPAVANRLEFTIDESGNIRDAASTELRRLRKEIIEAQAKLRRRIESILKQWIEAGYVYDDAQPTIRNARLVLPLAAEFKRKVNGFIHDQSATGQTVFMEPAEIFELNNLVKELEFDEQREIYRILLQLTEYLRPHVTEITALLNWMGMMDFIRAKARLAVETGGVFPESSPKTALSWNKVSHPLLTVAFKAQGRKVVPSNIHLDETKRVLIVSGPNAGGKSILLKSVGLIQVMWQHGLLVPVAEDSTLGIFKDIFVDIGDDQSLENDLSTYSSHLSNMNSLLKIADRNSLFLIDEFGTGTDPQFGGAIAESILRDLLRQKAWGVVTTHYSNLKVLAESVQGIMNGSMRFDLKALEPLYMLETGKPGSSFALEIATKIGLPKAIIEDATKKAGASSVSLERLLNELEDEKNRFEKLATETKAKEEKLNGLIKDYSRLKELIELQKKNLLNVAKAEAAELLKDANKKIEATIKEIKEAKAEKEITKELRKELQDFADTIQQEYIDPAQLKAIEEANAAAKAGKKAKVALPKPEPVEDVPADIISGAYVLITDTGTYAQVIEISGKEADIRIGALKSKVKVNRLKRIGKREFERATGENNTASRFQGIDVNRKMQEFSVRLDLRGKRGEEALTELSWFIDDALLLGVEEVQVIHGKGDGILRQLVRNYLSGYKQVASMDDEHADRGGAGVTVARLNS